MFTTLNLILIFNSIFINILTAFLLVVATGIIMFQKKQLQNLRNKKLLQLSVEQEVLSAKLEIQEQNLKNISKEVHDNIGQGLTLAKLTLGTMEGEEANLLSEKIGSCKLLVSKALQDLRDLSKRFQPHFIYNAGLVQAIKYEIEMVKKFSSFKTVVTEEGDDFILSLQHELILFRIFQELLANISKHSQATEVRVNLIFTIECFELLVKDNGKGFNIDKVKREGFGLGLKNIENRTKVIGAGLNLVSEMGLGTMVKINLPIA